MEFIWLPPFRDCFVLSSGNKQKTGGIRTPPAKDFYEDFFSGLFAVDLDFNHRIYRHDGTAHRCCDQDFRLAEHRFVLVHQVIWQIGKILFAQTADEEGAKDDNLWINV